MFGVCAANLTVEAKQQQHNEEENCPECRKRHHGYSLGVGNECQAWTCRGEGVCGEGGEQTEGGGRGGGEATLVPSLTHRICIPVGRKGPKQWRRRTRNEYMVKTSTALRIVVSCERVVCLHNCYVLSILDCSVHLILTYLLIMIFVY